jgi:hypothetical protein
MRHSVILIATLALGLSACGEMKQAAEDGFKKEFVPSFTQECVKGAAASGIPTDMLTKTCECTATELVETQSMTDLASLDMEKAMPIFQKCAAKAGLDMGAPSTAEPQQGE